MKKLAPWLIAPILLVTCFIQGCGSRGETRTMAEVLELARRDYDGVRRVAMRHGVSPRISPILSEIEQILSGFGAESRPGEKARSCRRMAELMLQLAPSAGYPSRPAFGEMAKAYGSCAGDGQRVHLQTENEAFESESLPLLVARSYHLLAAELGAARFSVS